MRRRETYEDGLQRATAQYLDARGWLWCHVANERKTTPARGRRLKDKGVKRGVPDVMIFERWAETFPGHGLPADGVGLGGCGFGIAIELKSPKGTTTKDQDLWLAELRHRGWRVAVCRTIEEVIETCEVIDAAR